MRKFTFALISVTSVAAFSWGIMIASIWLPVDERALPAVRSAATVSAVAVMLLLSLRSLRGLLRGRGMTYLVDAMLTQRAEARRKPPTEPLRVVR